MLQENTATPGKASVLSRGWTCQRRRRARAKTPRLHHHDDGGLLHEPPTPPTPPSDIESFSNTSAPLRVADQKQNARVFCFDSRLL